MTFKNEKEGQIEFYTLLKKIDGTIPEYGDFTDGIIKGTILEFKLKIDNINAVLLQSIKYLSKKRNNGENIPSQILLISLNEEKAFLFDSENFLKEIETQYTGSASTNNNSFFTNIKPKEINYKNNLIEIVNILKNEKYLKVNIDLFCVYGYAKKFYSEDYKRTKINFFNELRNPKILNIHKWEGKEEDFKYIMDCLNDNQHKKELGAFYTPKEYVRLSTKMVREAIKRIKEETTNDYIILDRCAGTGNLEQFLTDKDIDEITIEELDNYLDEETKEKYLQSLDKILLLLSKEKNIDKITLGELKDYEGDIKIRDYFFDNELSHCIVNTYELKEWIVLNNLIGNKVRMIIPPPGNIKKDESLVSGGDALSEYFVTGQYNLDEIQNQKNIKEYFDCIRKLNSYVSDEKINVIILENPPFRDTTTNSNGKASKGFTNFVKNEMKRNGIKGSILNDLSNQFIWSAQNYYLKKRNDYFILFSPVKYFKSCNLCNKAFIDGYLLNRKHFHATASAISLILWQNINRQQEEFELKAYDINKNEKLEFVKKIDIKKTHKTFDLLVDTRLFNNDIVFNIFCEFNGYERIKNKNEGKSIFNENIIAYLRVKGFSCDQKIYQLTRFKNYINRGFYLRSDNYITKLPLFCTKLYPQENWYEKDIYFTTADKGEEYLQDKDLLKYCFIYTCLCRQNKCISFNGSDGRFYRNELCFDENTIANNDLKTFELNDNEEELIKIWFDILKEAKKTKNYNKTFAYGLYQIDEELNIHYKFDVNGNKLYPNDKNYSNKSNSRIYYDYVNLNSNINTLKEKLKQYYKGCIQDKLFEYELLK